VRADEGAMTALLILAALVACALVAGWRLVYWTAATRGPIARPLGAVLESP